MRTKCNAPRPLPGSRTSEPATSSLQDLQAGKFAILSHLQQPRRTGELKNGSNVRTEEKQQYRREQIKKENCTGLRGQEKLPDAGFSRRHALQSTVGGWRAKAREPKQESGFQVLSSPKRVGSPRLAERFALLILFNSAPNPVNGTCVRVSTV